MNDAIARLERRGLVRHVQPDSARARSLWEAAERVGTAATRLPLTEDTATIVFREVYESLRQLGEALAYALGLKIESQQGAHEVALTLLAALDVPRKAELQHLDRFRRLRNDANYRGTIVTLAQAQEIVAFWSAHGPELLSAVRKRAPVR